MQRHKDWVAVGARWIRKLPVFAVRILCFIDLTLCLIPFWGYFAHRRWTRRRLSPGEFAPMYVRGVRFVLKHLRHTGQGTGPFAMSWLSAPVRRSPLPERSDHATRNSCGACRNCCTTHWLPEAEKVVCPLLSEAGCTVYAGIYWDYFNCGRYPAEPPHTRIYDCERFGAPAIAHLTAAEACV
jgi:hypothetical protein